MNGYSVNTYKFISHDDQISYVRFHLKSNQGLRFLDPSKGFVLAGIDGDYATRDLYNAICLEKDSPSWHVSI